jgi:hypothetical protein
MVHEEGQPWMALAIDACEPPHRLVISATDEYGGWHLEAMLVERANITELRFTHHHIDSKSVGEVGPGWEYYLDASSPRATAGRRRTSTTTTRP